MQKLFSPKPKHNISVDKSTIGASGAFTTRGESRVSPLSCAAIPMFLATLLLAVSCGSTPLRSSKSQVLAVAEDSSEYENKLSFSQSGPGAVPLDSGLAQSFIDVRGVGDSAWASLKTETPETSQMGAALQDFDPSGKILRGDVNFMNYESTVATRCNNWYDVEFAFLSSPKSVQEAISHGFNLFSLSNNHAEDCENAEDGIPGGLASRNHMNELSRSANIQWHGVGEGSELTEVSVKTYSNKGRSFKVAFAAVTFEGWETGNTARGEDDYHAQQILENLKSANADVRILSIHTQGFFANAKALARNFISNYKGDIVFAEGPHTWAGVEAVSKSEGGYGVAFHGLGNFLHTQCSDNPDNLIGRVLLDKTTLKPRQIQIIPVLNHFGGSVELVPSLDSLPIANFDWKPTTLSAHQNVPAAYFNLPNN